MPDVGYYWPSTNNAWTVIEPPSAEFLAEHPWSEDAIEVPTCGVAAFPAMKWGVHLRACVARAPDIRRRFCRTRPATDSRLCLCFRDDRGAHRFGTSDADIRRRIMRCA